MTEKYKPYLCCALMKKFTKQNSKKIIYRANQREHLMLVISNHSYQRLQYCFFCGTKLPDDLTDIWEKTIKKELKVDDPWDALYEETLPKEFMTDQWWKKRGL